MANKPNTKIHTHIGHERSLCGLAPKNGVYRIVSFSSFLTASDDDQCATCIERLRARGYNITELRKKNRAIYDFAQELALIS
jgi:hypothetical protein